MLTHIAAPVTTVAEVPRQSERRHGVRTPTIFSAYSIPAWILARC